MLLARCSMRAIADTSGGALDQMEASKRMVDSVLLRTSCCLEYTAALDWFCLLGRLPGAFGRENMCRVQGGAGPTPEAQAAVQPCA